MNFFNSHPSFIGYSASNIVKWYYDKAWSTLTGAKRTIVARTVDMYLAEVVEAQRTVRFNIPQNPENADEFLECNKKNVKIIDDFFADNQVRNKHFRDCLEVFVARAIDEIFDTNCCEILRQRLFPQAVIPETQSELDALLVETNSKYTEAVNECVRVFRNGLQDDSEGELEILESKLLAVREGLDKNVGAIEHELKRRKHQKKPA